ncbi:unnamed protein product [Kuraishia capsulata CBS 1993]|uniref:Vacuolar segregation protein 7 n=1 Tax=Kuraishia capsulata CBS 1993 TaxID=1382522 RepID=W6MJ55_9ASCO|nr:uncharacterized protein KUCA_T00002491001 [Kuraishia capsulata CBS 1993]CDK26519.1 unnamed protein product [Kuraishia capsulata CBS 1993]
MSSNEPKEPVEVSAKNSAERQVSHQKYPATDLRHKGGLLSVETETVDTAGIHILPLTHQQGMVNSENLSLANLPSGTSTQAHSTPLLSPALDTTSSMSSANNSTTHGAMNGPAADLHNTLRSKRSIIEPSLFNGNEDIDGHSTGDRAASGPKIASNPNSVRLQKKSAATGMGPVRTQTSTSTNSNHPIKSATRVDFFAARVHDAIKNDKGESSDSDETFVYDNAPQQGTAADVSAQMPARDLKQPSIAGSTGVSGVATVGSSNVTGTNSGVASKTGSVVGLASVTATQRSQQLLGKKDMVDSQSIYSVSDSFVPSGNTAYGSTTSNEMPNSGSKHSQQKTFKNLRDFADSPMGSDDDQVDELNDGKEAISPFTKGNQGSIRSNRRFSKGNVADKISLSPNSPANRVGEGNESSKAPQLRAITSKLFDSKGTLPRRYSGVDFNAFNDEDLDEDDFDFVADPDEESELEFGSYGKGGYADLRRNLSSMSYPNNGYGSLDSDGNGTKLDKPRRMIRRKKANTGMYYSPHNFTGSRSARWRQVKNFCYTLGLIMLLLSVGFVSGFLLATTKDLQDVKITEIQDIIISQEELVFNVGVQAFNPGFWSIVVSEAEIDVFAQTAFSKVKAKDCPKETDPNKPLVPIPKVDEADNGALETVLLGTVRSFEMPLVFQGGFFTRQKSQSMTEIKLLDPCSKDEDKNGEDQNDGKPPVEANEKVLTGLNDGRENADGRSRDMQGTYYETFGSESCDINDIPGRKKWSHISKHPFDLIIRGVLTYRLPLSGSNSTIGVNKVVSIDPDKPIDPIKTWEEWH